jgi:hypothetical protein
MKREVLVNYYLRAEYCVDDICSVQKSEMIKGKIHDNWPKLKIRATNKQRSEKKNDPFFHYEFSVCRRPPYSLISD